MLVQNLNTEYCLVHIQIIKWDHFALFPSLPLSHTVCFFSASYRDVHHINLMMTTIFWCTLLLSARLVCEWTELPARINSDYIGKIYNYNQHPPCVSHLDMGRGKSDCHETWNHSWKHNNQPYLHQLQWIDVKKVYSGEKKSHSNTKPKHMTTNELISEWNVWIVSSELKAKQMAN